MDIETKMSLVREVGEEIVTEAELKTLLETKTHPIAYDGMEPSGRMHIAQGIMRANNTNKLLDAGITFKFWVADWFGWANNKLGGDLEKIQTTGKYMIEVWKACGMKSSKVEFLWAKDVMADDEYWKKVMNIGRTTTLKRILRCSQIMGRSESDTLYSSQIFYPAMQCADIFHLKADITQLGMDQRKVNMLAREVGPNLGFWKPVVVSNHMLMGLGHPPKGELSAVERANAMKMSKSKPQTAIFMTDSEKEVKNKINKAYCPVRVKEENPLLEYCKYIIFDSFDSFEIKRSEKFGGSVNFETYKKLENAYVKGDIHPADLKPAVGEYINQLLIPVRKHFSKGNPKKLLEQVTSFQVTR